MSSSADVEFGNSVFRALLSLSDAALYTTDLNSLVTFWSPGAERLFGFAPDEAIGRRLPDLLIYNDDEQERRLLEAILAGGSIRESTRSAAGATGAGSPCRSAFCRC
ncbi:MAG TPA: PAS domain S-box protein [Vicinamibacterales bacterium]|nr:PAS domain S-box protein [Vicinamibacterales bacterium]